MSERAKSEPTRVYLYSLYLHDPADAATLGLVLEEDQPLYIGITANPELERPFRHIKPGRSRKGTVRKTLHALWPDLLVSDWFAEHVGVSIEPYADISRRELEQIERRLIQAWRPPLNLDHWDNPLRELVREPRRAVKVGRRAEALS